jgi:spore germination protein YaaH
MIYISHEVLRDYVDECIYYDTQERIATLTNLEEVWRFYANSTDIKLNGVYGTMDSPLLVRENRAYFPLDFLESKYPLEVVKGGDGRLFVASDLGIQRQIATVTKKKAVLRTHPDKDKWIIETVNKGENVVVYSTEGDYTRVRSENGIIGYIKTNCIEVDGVTSYEEDKVYVAQPLPNPLNEKVRLVWDQMTYIPDGTLSADKYKNMTYANVISPTWFEFADYEGNLIDRGSLNYTRRAKEKGLQVWALLSHSFTEPELTKEILTSTNKRQHVINQLIQAVQNYELDGINIDIENVQADFGSEWVQFMRELYPQMNQLGVTVSVDIYMPSAWSTHYERDRISEVVDYFIVMAYDQHWSGSEEAGSVADLNWVENGLQTNLEEVPKEKLILGVPFFTRIWAENREGLTSTSYSMYAALKEVEAWGVTIYYDNVLGQHYAEKLQGETTYRVWLEDETSMQNRVKLIETYDLAGVAGWKLGLETNAVWDILKEVK